MSQENTTQEQVISPFEEIKDMSTAKAVNILLAASNAAQRAGALSVRDSVLVASAGEYLAATLGNTSNNS